MIDCENMNDAEGDFEIRQWKLSVKKDRLLLLSVQTGEPEARFG